MVAKEAMEILEDMVTLAMQSGTFIRGQFCLTVNDADLNGRLYKLAKEYVAEYEYEDDEEE